MARPTAAGRAKAIAALTILGVIVSGGSGSDRDDRRFDRPAETDDEHDRRQQPMDQPLRPKIPAGAFHSVGFHNTPDSVPGGTHQGLIIEGQAHVVK